jgi:hypothetical protein
MARCDDEEDIHSQNSHGDGYRRGHNPYWNMIKLLTMIKCLPLFSRPIYGIPFDMIHQDGQTAITTLKVEENIYYTANT